MLACSSGQAHVGGGHTWPSSEGAALRSRLPGQPDTSIMLAVCVGDRAVGGSGADSARAPARGASGHLHRKPARPQRLQSALQGAPH